VIYLIALLVLCATAFVVMLVLQLMPSDSAVIRRLGDMQRVEGYQTVIVRRRRGALSVPGRAAAILSGPLPQRPAGAGSRFRDARSDGQGGCLRVA